MKRYLEEAGFSLGEEKTYLALLRIGESSTGNISKEANISRSKIYEVLDKLVKKGLVSHFKKNNRKIFRAEAPNSILNYLDEKKGIIENEKKNFEKNMPLFESLIAKKEILKEAEVFEGIEGIKNVREIALKTMNPGEIIYYFGNPASGHEHLLGYWDDWNDRRISKKVEAWIVYNQDARKFGERRIKQPYTKVRYLPTDGKSHAWVEIYRDTIVIAIKYETPMSIVMNNKFIAESFRTYFNIMWEFGLTK